MMKIYDMQFAPNPRRVRIFLAEKGIDVDYVQVDLGAGENLSDEMRAKNPTTKIPFLELDDGTCIGETTAICRYFEETNPENPLLGRDPVEKAQVETWIRRVDLHFMEPAGMGFKHTSGFYKDRMVVVPEYGPVSVKIASDYLDDLNDHLANSKYLVGDYFSAADINLICGIDFATMLIKVGVGEQHEHLKRWYDDVSSRPTMQA